MDEMNKRLKMNSREKNILAGTPLMAALGKPALQHMTEIATVVHFEARDILAREGDAAEYFYCVLTGYVRLFRLSRDGREADIRICGPGETFGECLLYLGPAYRYHIQAAETVTVARFELSKLRKLADEDRDIARFIMQSMAAHLVNIMDCVANDRLQTAPQRLAHYLLNSCPQNSASASIRLPFQKSLLAGKLGLAPEALSRAFSSLKRAGVTVRGRLILINDVSALRQI